MKSFKVQQVATLATAIAASFLTVSCTSAKITQCANTIEVVNQTVVSTKAISNSGTKGDIQTIEKLVEIFDKAAKDLESVNVSDEKLNTYKSQFLTMYKGTTDVTKQLIVSIKEKKATKVNEGLKKYASSVSPERDLVTGLNQYCQEPEKK
jgi:bifunctional DNase/RNase